jgi:DNA-binding CsgD family transcriptional regulator
MIDAISQIGGNLPLNQTASPDPQPATNRSDTAILSESAQALLLEHQGLTIVEIADALGITQNAVLGALGVITPNTQAKTATA